MIGDGIGWEKERKMEFIIAVEATGQLSGLEIRYQYAVVFLWIN